MVCMEKQELVYITGHQHPDTDSVVSAIAYALLKRAMGVKAVACRLGPLSNETKYVLNRFGYEEPMLLEDARKKLSEISIDSPAAISPDAPAPITATSYFTMPKIQAYNHEHICYRSNIWNLFRHCIYRKSNDIHYFLKCTFLLDTYM